MKYKSLLILPFLFFNCYTVDRDCNDFRTGTFQFSYTVDGIKKTGKFIRTEDLNIDYYENQVDSASIRWINDCEFVMKKINPRNKSEEEAIHMKILSTSDSSYTFEYKLAVKKMNKLQRVEKGTAYKIE